MAFELIALPYATDALEPGISRHTLELHHGKHHRGYVAKLNDLVKGTAFEGTALPAIVRNSKAAIFNNAAQVWNHDFYWGCLAPGGSPKPAGALAKAIDASFGSFAGLEAKFKALATGKFGSGWTWLVREAGGRLALRNSDDADNPLLWDEAPLLACDVWEHAYYIDYRSERPKYIDAFWKLADWDFAARNFAGALAEAATPAECQPL